MSFTHNNDLIVIYVAQLLCCTVNSAISKYFCISKGMSASQLFNSIWNELLRCYIGTATSHDFDSKESLRRWMWRLVMKILLFSICFAP